jgi:transcriptional regulator with XRE-family HTH domain
MPPPRGCPQELTTLGDHVKKARLDRDLLQEDLARELGVSIGTVVNWEKNLTQVATRYLPKVVAFLGYDPRERSGSLGARIRARREGQGLSQEVLAERLGVNPSTVRAWERGEVRRLFPTVRMRFEEFLAGG